MPFFKTYTTGVGIVIRNGGALAETEILGILLTRKIPFSIGEFKMFFNIFIFGWEQAMYSIFTYYIASKTIDAVIQGLDETKAVIIISDEYEELGFAINKRLGRSTTNLKVSGGFSGQEKEVIYVVVTRLEITKLKTIVYEIDPHAFITIMAAQDAHGGQFKVPIH